MEIFCTRPHCANPRNFFPGLEDKATLATSQQKYCTSCGMPLILAGRYIPLKLLGQGGFGAAFLAVDRYTPTIRQCVVKQFQPSINLGPQELALAQQLFEREATVLERLGHRHPQIPNLYAYFPLIVPNQFQQKEEQFFYLVQEFIDGETLEAELAQKGTFSETAVRKVLEEMLEVLAFVHENDSIHRDIKPSNIIRNQEGLLYLLDFGAVKQVTNQAASSPRKASTGIYSLGFAPPEQMGGEEVFPSTDLYALAVTCINLLTGKPPTDLYDNRKLQWTWRNFAPQVSDRLANILDSMLKFIPEDRFQSAQEVLTELKYPTTLNSQPPVPVTPTPPPVVSQPPTPITPTPPPQLPTPQSQPQKPEKPRKTPKPAKPRKPSPPPKPFSVMRMVTLSGMIGFETTLVSIAAISTLWIPNGLYVAAGVLVLLIILAALRITETLELFLLILVSLLLIWWIPQLHEVIYSESLPKFFVIFFPILGGAVLIAIASFMRLIYRILTSIFGSK